MFEWAYEGINGSIPRTIGLECANYLTPKRRIIETFFISIYLYFLMRWCLKRMKISLPKKVSCIKQNTPAKTFLLCLTCLVFGCEIGIKLMGKTFINILNPCHIITIAEVSPLLGKMEM